MELHENVTITAWDTLIFFFFFLKVEASIAVGEILLEINYVEQSYPLEYIIQDFTTAGSSP